VNAWNWVKNATSAAWNWIVNIVKTYGIYLLAVILGPAVLIVALIITHWSQIKAFISNTWNSIIGTAKQWASNLVSTAVNLKNQFVQHVQDLIHSITNFFTSLPGQALQWGKNLIQSFLNGISNIAGGIGGFLNDHVLGPIKNMLGFASPTKEGPGKELDMWGPNMVKGFAKGIDKASPVLRASLNALVAPMIGYPVRSSAGSSVVYAGGGSSSRGNAGEVTIIVELDSHVLAKATGVATDRIVRLKLGAHGRAA
jgi:phage-related protein